MAQQGDDKEGLALMRESATERLAMGVRWYQPRYLCMLAESYLQHGSADEGLVAIAEAKELAARAEEHMWEAELNRIEGERRRIQGLPAPQIEALFMAALEIARDQNAKSFELRAALSLAKLWRDLGRRAEAREVLAPFYGWFTEGLDTPDLVAAEVLLKDL
jgi:predicted ATPase